MAAARAQSEEGAWDSILGHVEAIRRQLQFPLIGASQQDTVDFKRTLRRELAALEGTARLMKQQVRAGLHANPGLVVYGNPRGGRRQNPTLELGRRGIMSRRVLGLEYQHAKDREDYRHDFNRGVEMWALASGDILLTHSSGLNLWQEFPE